MICVVLDVALDVKKIYKWISFGTLPWWTRKLQNNDSADEKPALNSNPKKLLLFIILIKLNTNLEFITKILIIK